jgi:hypothetical protein
MTKRRAQTPAATPEETPSVPTIDPHTPVRWSPEMMRDHLERIEHGPPPAPAPRDEDGPR